MSKLSDMESIMNMIGMKRPREEYSDSITAMANCLMLLSGAGGDQLQLLNINTAAANNKQHHRYRDVSPSRVFECKTCSRQFPSFQALGGHRASHKKPKLIGGDLSLQPESSPAKPKTHECSICGQEFAVGQALGGHMRRHRAAVSESPAVAPVIIEKSNSEKRIWGLDLNLAPMENDNLDFGLGKLVSPPVLGCVS